MALRSVKLLITLICLTGCSKTVEVEKQMTWSCDPRPNNRPQWALWLRYVDSPQHIEYIADPKLCRALAESGRRVVTVRFRVWSDGLRGGLLGYNIITVDGRPETADVPGGGASAREGEAGPHPLEAALQ